MIDDLVKKYLEYEKVEEHKKAIEKLVEKNDQQQLERLIGKRLTFGTAGIRGNMGPGFGQMNDLVIIQTSQGLVSYMLELDGEAAKERGVIIGHDARHNSDRFARLTALAFLQKNIRVYFCERIIPTPVIAFGIGHFACSAGIVITASHNPKNDNGYKVFFSNGAQILSPHDKQIQEHIMKPENQQPWPLAWHQEFLLTSSQTNDPQQAHIPKNWLQESGGLLCKVYGDLSKTYFSYIDSLIGERRSFNQSSNTCITYTTMHGVGHIFLSRALDIAGFDDVFPVEAQKNPDPDFSTVKFPNPEEAGALDLAFETAKHANSNLILATDPDADRCAAALYNPTINYKRVLTGNEIGTLLGWWIWHCYKSNRNNLEPSGVGQQVKDKAKETLEKHSSDESQEAFKVKLDYKPNDCYMISTAVSSKFLHSMATIEGFNFVETLTGFKYMGNFADELIRKNQKCVLFAYEEAIGYMVNSNILDKDGISAAIQLAQCSAYVSTTYGRTLEQHLDYLYTIYGYHYNLNSYYICTNSAIIREIFTNIQKNYPKSFGDKSQFIVNRVRDLNNGFDSGTADKKATLPCSSSSFMVTFFIDNDVTITLRTSGTEPKIKYYSEIVSRLPQLKSTSLAANNFNDEIQLAAKEKARNKLSQVVGAVITQCLKPTHYDLEPAD